MSQIKMIGPHEVLEARKVEHAQKTRCNTHHQCEVTYPASPLYYQQSESESYTSIVQENYFTGRKYSLESKLHHFANGKFAAFKLCLLLFFKDISLITYLYIVIDIQKS